MACWPCSCAPAGVLEHTLLLALAHLTDLPGAPRGRACLLALPPLQLAVKVGDEVQVAYNEKCEVGAALRAAGWG